MIHQAKRSSLILRKVGSLPRWLLNRTLAYNRYVVMEYADFGNEHPNASVGNASLVQRLRCRPTTPDDFETLARPEYRLSQRQRAQAQEDIARGDVWIVGEIDGRIVLYSSVRVGGELRFPTGSLQMGLDCATVGMTFTIEEFRNKGLNLGVRTYTLNLARDFGATRKILYTSAWNKAALAITLHHGFVIIGSAHTIQFFHRWGFLWASKQLTARLTPRAISIATAAVTGSPN